MLGGCYFGFKYSEGRGAIESAYEARTVSCMKTSRLQGLHEADNILTYSTSHKRLAGLDVAGEFALVDHGVGVLRHDEDI